MSDTKNIKTYITLNSTLDLTAQSLRNLLGDTSRILVFPPGLGMSENSLTAPAHLPFVLFAPYKRPPGLQNNRNRVIDELPPPSFAIALPLPTSALKTEYGVEYAPVEMGAQLELLADRFSNIDIKNLSTKSIMESVFSRNTLGGLLEGGIGALSLSAISQLTTGKNTKTKEILLNTLKNAGIGSAVGAAVGEAQVQAATFATVKNILNSVIDQNMTNMISASSGVAENPFTEQIFKNVKLRNFQYTFVFMPRNSIEAVFIDKIIQLFKFYMLPAYYSPDGWLPSDEISKQGLFFSYPYEFQITYSVQDTTFSLLPSVLTSVVVAHNDGMDSPKFFVSEDDGKQYPIKTNLVLNFTEVMIMTRDKVMIHDQQAFDEAVPKGSTLSTRIRF